MAGLNPVYDAQVYAFEEILGGRFSLVGVQSFHLLWPISLLALEAYVALPMGLALVAGTQTSLRREIEVIAAAITLGIAAFLLYRICPVVGPLTAFGPSYPQSLPRLPLDKVPLLSVPVGPPRNGMPSLHAAWALLVWFNAKRLSIDWRYGLRAFVAMTLWAVMGRDDTHWLMDVVVAVPMAAAVQLLCASGATGHARWWGVAGGALLTVVWLLAFRHPALLLRLPPLGRLDGGGVDRSRAGLVAASGASVIIGGATRSSLGAREHLSRACLTWGSFAILRA
jgi:hypothetical protein